MQEGLGFAVSGFCSGWGGRSKFRGFSYLGLRLCTKEKRIIFILIFIFIFMLIVISITVVVIFTSIMTAIMKR